MNSSRSQRTRLPRSHETVGAEKNPGKNPSLTSNFLFSCSAENRKLLVRLGFFSVPTASRRTPPPLLELPKLTLCCISELGDPRSHDLQILDCGVNRAENAACRFQGMVRLP